MQGLIRRQGASFDAVGHLLHEPAHLLHLGFQGPQGTVLVAGPAETEPAVTETPFAAEPLPETPTAQESVVDPGAGEAASGGERPEVAVAAAFAGGLLLARTLKRFAD